MEQKISKFLRNGSSQNKAWFLCNSGIVWKLSCQHLLFVIIYDLIVSDFDFVSPKWAWRSCSWKKSDKRPDRPWVRYLEGVGGFWWHNTEGHLQLVIFLIKNCKFTYPRASIKDAQAIGDAFAFVLYFCWKYFALLHPDPDPKHCILL